MISRAKFNDHTHPLFCNKHILKLDDLYQWEIAKTILKYKQDAIPKPLMVLFKTQNEIHNKNTRQRNDLRIRNHTHNDPWFKWHYLQRTPDMELSTSTI